MAVTKRQIAGMWLLAAVAALVWARPGATEVDNTLKFAAEMAENGNWREAMYRWELASSEIPENPRIINNLAVATEALGDHEEAARLYRQARDLAPGEPPIIDNAERSRRFWQGVTGEEVDPVDPVEAMRAARNSEDGKKKKKKTKGTVQVQVALPVPPRIELQGDETLLVASFLGREEEIVDTNREFVRFLRRQFEQRTPLETLNVTPVPAIPEQTLEQLAVNREFWKHLGRKHEADIIVSGAVSYDRRDISGFKDVDIVSPTTGQKVRQTRFVEQEEFLYTVTLLFLDGASGELLFRDTINRGISYRGQSNDPIEAFYEIAETIASDVLAVVVPRRRIDSRVIYRTS